MRAGQRVRRLAVRYERPPCSSGRHQWQKRSIDVRSCACGISRIRIRDVDGCRFAYTDARISSCTGGHDDNAADVAAHVKHIGRYLQGGQTAGLLTL